MNESTYTTELTIEDIKPGTIMAMLPEAASTLGWQPIDARAGQMAYTVPGKGESYGEEVTVGLSGGKVTFTSRGINEYYWPENRNEANALRLTRAIAAS